VIILKLEASGGFRGGNASKSQGSWVGIGGGDNLRSFWYFRTIYRSTSANGSGGGGGGLEFVNNGRFRWWRRVVMAQYWYKRDLR
jgi:hypothetical protein